MPVRDVLVCDARRDIEHDDAALSINVVAISEAAKFLLSSSIPHIEVDLTQVLMVCLAHPLLSSMRHQ